MGKKSSRDAPVICHYAVASHLGGTERSLLELCEGTIRDGRYRPWVILPGEGPLAEKLREAGVSFDVVPMPQEVLQMSRGKLAHSLLGLVRSSPAMSAYLARLAGLLSERRAALMHTHSIKCHVLSSLIAPFLNTPMIWHLRDILAPGPVAWGLSGIRRAIPGLQVIANSRATAQAFLGRTPTSQERWLRVIHNGLDSGIFFPKRNRIFNEKLGLAQDAPIVGIAGVLARWKGQRDFLEMASLLIEQGCRAGFAIVGGEIYDTSAERGFEKELKARARELGIEKRVLFTGFRSDAAESINALDVLVHASIRPEPFGRVIIEAMACGVPLVATAAGGVLEIVDDGESGLLAPPGSPKALAFQVERLLAEPELAKSLASAGRERFLSSFTSERCVRSVIEAYEETLVGETAFR